MTTSSSGRLRVGRNLLRQFPRRTILCIIPVVVSLGQIRSSIGPAHVLHTGQSDEDSWRLPPTYALADDLTMATITSSNALSDTDDTNDDNIKIALYITTHFSEVHIRYFHCCWPLLVQTSPLIRRSHVIIAATNATPIPPEELEYLEHTLFLPKKHVQSYQFWTPSNDGGDANSKASHLLHCEPYMNTTHPHRHKGHNKAMSVSYKQCLANYGVSFGWPKLIAQNYDWMIRINPDVLIRQAQWLLQAMNNSTLDAVLVHCGPKTRQIHTDFWAVRLAALQPPASTSSATITTMPEIMPVANKNTNLLQPFEHMGKIGIHLNHERTAFQHFRPILASKRYTGVPHVEPSHGICRVRGQSSYILHDHDSCTSNSSDHYDNHRTCHGLDGWDLTK